MKGSERTRTSEKSITNSNPAFRSPSGEVHIVRPEAHAARMNRSAALVSIQAIPEAHFLRCVNLAVAYNGDLVPPHSASAMLYVRPFVFGSGPWFQLSPTNEYTFCVFVAPISALHGVNPIDALVLEDFDRAATRGVGSGKVGGNYAPVMKWSEKAKSEGYPITLHLDSQTQTEIEEFTTSAFVGIIDASKSRSGVTTLVVSNSRSIVESITSDTMVHLAKALGWAVECRTVRLPHLCCQVFYADEYVSRRSNMRRSSSSQKYWPVELVSRSCQSGPLPAPVLQTRLSIWSRIVVLVRIQSRWQTQSTKRIRTRRPTNSVGLGKSRVRP
jgi:branched-subunit amino acid aminotransferase/4-amino-4-deoxychorismate lyase